MLEFLACRVYILQDRRLDLVHVTGCLCVVQLADVRPRALLHHVINTAQHPPLHCRLLPPMGCNTSLAAMPQDQTTATVTVAAQAMW